MHPELTTLQNALVISTDDRADKLQLRMTCNQRWKTHSSGNLLCDKTRRAESRGSLFLGIPGDDQNSPKEIFHFHMTLLAHTPSLRSRSQLHGLLQQGSSGGALRSCGPMKLHKKPQAQTKHELHSPSSALRVTDHLSWNTRPWGGGKGHTLFARSNKK